MTTLRSAAAKLQLSKRQLRCGAPYLALLVLLAMPLAAQTNVATQHAAKVSLSQKLDTRIPLDLMFRDETGKVVRLGDYFQSGRKPILLSFMYYRCPMLCSMVMEGTTSTLTELKFDVGREFDVISVSIDPRDDAAEAARQKEKYVKRYGRLDSADGWHFLTAHQGSIKELTDAVGFRYSYDMESDQFAHAAALLVLTPDGRVSRYFYGFEYDPTDVRLGLVEASNGKIGSARDQVMLLCYHYDPSTGKYSKNAMAFVRAGGVATIATLGGFIFVMLRRERRHARSSTK